MRFIHYSEFADPVTRDLAWLLDRRHDLPVALPPFLPFEPCHSSSITLEPDTLRQRHGINLTNQFNRLGVYFEDLVEVLLRAVSDPGEQFRRNVQVVDQTSKTTLGELDFVFQSRGLTHHLEVAVKFYAERGSADAAQWLGENTSDSLSAKLTHLRARQLPRSHDMACITGQRCYWLKGRLFRSLSASASTALPVSGTWCYRHQLPSAAVQYPGNFALLPYERWLGGLWLEDARRLARPLTDWALELGALERSVMLSSVEAERADGWRIWVMPDHWPGEY